MKNVMKDDFINLNDLTQEEKTSILGGHWDGTITLFGAVIYDGNRPKGDRWIWQWE